MRGKTQFWRKSKTTVSRNSKKMSNSTRNSSQLLIDPKELKDSPHCISKTRYRCSKRSIFKRRSALPLQKMQIANRKAIASTKPSKPTWTARVKVQQERSTIRRWAKFRVSTMMAAKSMSSHWTIASSKNTTSLTSLPRWDQISCTASLKSSSRFSRASSRRSSLRNLVSLCRTASECAGALWTYRLRMLFSRKTRLDFSVSETVTTPQTYTGSSSTALKSRHTLSLKVKSW